MLLNTQFAATLYGFTSDRVTGRYTCRIVKTSNGMKYFLPLSQTLACKPVQDWHPPMATHWLTISNWLSRKTGIQDARTSGER